MTTIKQEKFLSGKVRIREAAQDDVSFIFNSWLKSYRHSINASHVPSQVFYASQHTLIEGLLRTARVLVACNHEDPAQIYGYICSETIEGAPVIHYIYVKEPYRILGLGKMLCETAGIDLQKPFFATHSTPASLRLSRKYPAVNNPYLAHYAFAAGRTAQADALVGEKKDSSTGLSAHNVERKD